MLRCAHVGFSQRGDFCVHARICVSLALLLRFRHPTSLCLFAKSFFSCFLIMAEAPPSPVPQRSIENEFVDDDFLSKYRIQKLYELVTDVIFLTGQEFTTGPRKGYVSDTYDYYPELVFTSPQVTRLAAFSGDCSNLHLHVLYILGALDGRTLDVLQGIVEHRVHIDEAARTRVVICILVALIASFHFFGKAEAASSLSHITSLQNTTFADHNDSPLTKL